jgi:hypothetical protein
MRRHIFFSRLLLHAVLLVNHFEHAEQACPNPIMAWDCNITTAAYVEVNRGAGGFGNNLFQFAAHVIFAVEKGLPLRVSDGVAASFQPNFPCLRSSRGIEDKNLSTWEKVQPPGGEFFQNISLWGDLGVARRVLQEALYMESVAAGNGTTPPPGVTPHGDTASSLEAHLAALMEGSEEPDTPPPSASSPSAPETSTRSLPGSDDLVIHFRSFAYAAHKRPTGSKEPVPAGTEADAVLCHGHGQYSLCAPPFVYFARIARRHVERFGVNQGRIVVVCEPKQRSHTTVKRLVSKFGAKVLTTNDHAKDSGLEDFRYMLGAKHLVLSPSTYGWWAGYLSASALEVYYPIPRARILFPWCALVPLASEATKVRARYVYEDWWQGESLRLNGTSTTIISTVSTADRAGSYRAFTSSPQLPSAIARQRCYTYEAFLANSNKKLQENKNQLEMLYKSSQPTGNATAKAISKSDVAAVASMPLASFAAGGI